MFTKYRLLALAMVMALVAAIAIMACSPAEPQVITERVEVPVTQVVEREVEKVVTEQVEVPVTQIVEREVEVEKEVPVEVTRVVTEEVVKEVEKIVEVMAPEGPKETIIFGDLNWSSALLQNRIAQYIVEKGYGYPTDVKFGATLPLFQGLQNGDTHVTMEIWLPNQNEAWNAAREEGAVLSVGQSLGKDWQSAFVIPAYLQEEYPDLDSVEDLKDQQYKDLFKTAETGDKARLVSCIIGWACEGVNAKQIEGYGLNDHVHIVNPGDGAALNADLYGAYERGEPWLGYQWGTNDPALKLDLVRLEEPPYSAECEYTTFACGYPDATILIAVYPDLPARAPGVVEMLRNWDFNIDIYKAVVRWQDANPDADVKATAIWWLNNNADVWGNWVTDDAAAAIQAALSAGEEADGWPTE
ncbi:MAG: ABC transporter substrate-binding protein [Dehalococcoidia bacterium]|nr:ABC transporter substrate-binding protein [Dehalococcoidia bacterium]